ncbi:exportin [Culex quinquefasciatus]|uniref:Exportin-4 n=1 Tax=Culex quinquefasciatus TaxID=7176 RepID=B0XFY4_CULQU|nr:exportin [Culex quinquefasciatus]|eukprot:XP_001868556.1 exportin [Culex quinquefasciatus]
MRRADEMDAVYPFRRPPNQRISKATKKINVPLRQPGSQLVNPLIHPRRGDPPGAEMTRLTQDQLLQVSPKIRSGKELVAIRRGLLAFFDEAGSATHNIDLHDLHWGLVLPPNPPTRTTSSCSRIGERRTQEVHLGSEAYHVPTACQKRFPLSNAIAYLFLVVMYDKTIDGRDRSAAPPTVVTKEQRQQSEAIFMNFRKTKSPYVLCQTILEKSVVDLVLFEAADVLKKAVVAEWKYIPDQDKASLRQYLLNYIIQRDIPVFIRDKLLQVVAIMIKRASLEDVGVERGQIIDETKKMMTSGDVKQQILSCSIILAILEEYCNIVRSDDTGLTTYEHFRAKKQFEDSDLLKVFIMTLQSMEELIKVFDAGNSMHLYLFKQMLSVMETILTWGFLLPKLQIVRVLQPSLSKKIIDTSETVTKALHAPPLRLHAQWKNVIFEPKLLEIFFFIYWKTRDNEDLQPKALICILQLSTLKGPIITDNKEESMTYLVNYLTHFLSMLSTIEIKEKEAYSFSLILRKLLQLQPRAEIKGLPNSLFNAYMQRTLTMTLKFIELSAMEEALSPDETVYIDALGNLLEIWLYIVNDKENYPVEVMVPFVTQMFEKYVQYHLAAPDGMRGVGRDSELIDEIAEFEESDRERFKEQLIIIGYFGREILGHSLPLLSKLLEDRTRNLGTQLHRLHSTKTMDEAGSKALVNLFEDIHWILLVTGHVLALEADGESAMIPGEILQMCSQQIASNVTDVNNSLKLLASPNQDIQEIPNAEMNADPVIRLIAAGFRLCELEKSAIEVRMYQFLSPELSTTLVWFMRRWSDAYLMPLNEDSTIVELILELVCEIVANIGNASSEKVIRTAVHECCFSVIRVYVKNNSNRVSLDTAKNDSDPLDLILILKLLNYLTSKSLFADDFAGSEDSSAQSAEICIFGLTHIVPLITVDLIKYPDLCLQYYSTITSFIEEKSHVIPSLHPDLLKQLLGSIELGLSSFTADIESKCLEFLEIYANGVYFHQDPSAPMAQLLRPFLKLMLDMIFGQKIDLNNTMDWYRTVFVVICCFPEHFKELLQHFLSEQFADAKQGAGKDVAASSVSLVNNMEFVNNRLVKSKFVDRFDKFVTLVSTMYKK